MLLLGVCAKLKQDLTEAFYGESYIFMHGLYQRNSIEGIMINLN
jgi:hypothetical protein